MEGRRGEVALYQTTLVAKGYDPGEIDGYFGSLTLEAAYAEIMDNGTGADDTGTFQEWFPDDGAVLEPAFVRLGIAC
jgi:peptidoglycan hydrolase-like protein with peptidoglycan-binding domain